jgi:hypothetical protein
MMIVTLTATLAGGIIQAQDWSCTFQRWGTTCGLLFEDTTLKSSVKVAIRDDIAKMYTLVSSNNLSTTVYTPDDSEYGTFIGYDMLADDNVMPDDLGAWEYKLYNGNRYFYIEGELSTKYKQQIALANKYKTAVNSLSNFLASAQAMTPANTSTNSFLQKFWHLNKDRVLLTSDDEEWNFIEYVQHWSSFYYIYPSILQFKYAPLKEGLDCLHAEIRTVKKADATTYSSLYIVYKEGQWRFLVWDW